ncbi:unnamed protein product, partial [Mesorhabditis belari]|uniref:Transcription initiation factor IIA subunit 2 n=1 Tax=Mesorhabditis belari TaxID=2138241 RepID=A0AAF3F3J5_9BILA
MNTSCEIYRETTLGTALQGVLENYVNDGRINEEIHKKMLKAFDTRMEEALHNNGRFKANFHAQTLVTYRLSEDVWRLVLKNVTFSDQSHWFDSYIPPLDRLLVVAIDGRDATSHTRRRPRGHRE